MNGGHFLLEVSTDLDEAVQSEAKVDDLLEGHGAKNWIGSSELALDAHGSSKNG